MFFWCKACRRTRSFPTRKPNCILCKSVRVCVDKPTAVLNTIEHLEKREGFEVTWLNVSQAGQIDLNQLADTIRDNTVLVSIMHANNETGVIQPLREISEICRERGVLLHSDMVQSFGKLAVIPSGVEGSRGEGFKITQRGPSTS